jgi:hypothetical protein
MELASDGSSLPLTYNFDATHAITLQAYLNDAYGPNDCVIAARAHHTVRLDYVDGLPIVNISDPEIRTEYTTEAGPFGGGIKLSDSLARWQNPGWTAGGVQRQIQGIGGPCTINGSGALGGDATTDLSLAQVRANIIQYTGVQVDLTLPDGITVNAPNTFGSLKWTDTSKQGSENNRHTMLLIGYDPAGFRGITWGTTQYMTSQFLLQYCVNVWWVIKGPTT